MSFQSTLCVLDSHVFFQKSTELKRPEVDVPNTVVDFFKSDIFSDTDNRDVHPIGVPTNAPIGAHVADFEALTLNSIKKDCLSRVILFGESALRRAISEYVEHDHRERNHQGKDNVLLFPSPELSQKKLDPVQCRERLGGLLKSYYRKAA